MCWKWPLLDCEKNILPEKIHPGSFAAIRKHDIHTGVDLYCNPGQKVVAVEDGIVVAIENFTGPNANPPSPWWNDTKAVLIEGQSGVVCYGEIEPLSYIKIGVKIECGDLIGSVQEVLKEDKGKPTSMLHFELYDVGTRESVIWELGKSQPSNLKDPMGKLQSTALNKDEQKESK